ncbi:MAG: hypothetical protein JNK74_24655 [Candidatus Hydrogenedentes bacterium]|nr:hypothetical protein [Candidatus Hydrogenedentota bacterium]
MNLRIHTALIRNACLAVALVALADPAPGAPLDREAFANPPTDCRPQTRWWWHGNALTKDDISRQLREMKAQGLGGAEQITMDEVYEKGNMLYLSPEYFELVKHAVAEAKSLGMTLSLNFGGPGWIWGGDWVPESMRTRCLLASMVNVSGPARFDAPLSLEAAVNPRDLPRSFPEILPEDKLVAVVAGRVAHGVLDPDTFQILTDRVQDRQLTWEVPEGDWRIMAFWSTIPEGSNAVNHLDTEAMKFYVETLGQHFVDALGRELGATVESLFGDSFEVPIHRNGIYWADSLPEQFKARKGQDLIPLLPALWWDAGERTGGARYAVNEMLHHQGMVAFFNTFNAWCQAHGVKSRIQPYGFVTDNLEGAGHSDIPEMEITAGEKDAVPWFDTRIGPREYVASGAHIYGRNIVSVEAYTYLHWEPYRATLEELKITSDTFLRAGANRFNNHGFIASPERDIAPTRGFYAAIHISPDNVWWPYYHHLSDYIARSCYLLRQGRPVADIAIYAPTASQWTKDALNARSWTRSFDWGELGRLLVSNGYQFDLVNDEVLQRRAEFVGPALRIQNNDYRVIILPNIEAMPLASLRRVEAYAEQGGTVIALERAPEAACDTLNAPEESVALRAAVSTLFRKSTGRDNLGLEGPSSRMAYGAGTTYWLEKVMDRSNILDRRSGSLDPFLRALNRHVAPDMAIDFVREDLRENNGLTFTHRRMEGRDLYFVTNIQDRPIDMPVGFRVTGAAPSLWDPISGNVTPLHLWEERDGATWLPLRLAPYASTFVVFEAGASLPHATSTTLDSVIDIDTESAVGWTSRAGEHRARLASGEMLRANVTGVPAPLAISGPWELVLSSDSFTPWRTDLEELESWTEIPEARHFSGTGRHVTAFTLPEGYESDDIRLELDLGDVGNVAEVVVNGKSAGAVWMRGQCLDITSLAVEGTNQLTVRVTNTLINRVSGLKEFPPVPEELRERLGRGVQDDNSPAHALLGYTPLPRSGLLGPVEIRAYKRVTLRR